MKTFYFNKFENRKPYSPVPDNKFREYLFQFTGIVTILLGSGYLHWRWMHSLNPDALWFAIPLVGAETLCFVGTILLIINLWSFRDVIKSGPVHFLSEIESLLNRHDRPVRIDIFIATYNEDVELVRYSIRDVKNIHYPHHDVKINIYVLDDGRRDGRNPEKQNMKNVAAEEGVAYLIREHNKGYKAGNLKNALEQTDGDLFVILDADTRPFPDFLINTTGYFRNKKLAWVQTPQWFYDTTEGEQISTKIINGLGIKNNRLTGIIQWAFGKISVNEDLFGNDPRLFYDVILRKRNFYNAAFCCGAGSIHRREAIMSLAVKDFVTGIKKQEEIKSKSKNNNRLAEAETKDYLLSQEIIPFKFHASEDIYTSLMLHSDQKNRWESIQHPHIECKMLSTQDLDSWVKQHLRYAEGTLDIAFKDNPVFKKGLSTGQKLCYLNTIWSYFAPLWILIFLLSPIVYFFTLAMPVKAYSFDFFKYFLPFQIMNTLAFTIGCWGVSSKRGDQYYIAGFWYMLLALISVVMGKKVKFNVTPKGKNEGNNLQHILPHLILISLTILGILYNMVLIIFNYHPSPSGFFSNCFWSALNIISLSVMVRAAYWKTEGIE